MGFGYGPPTIVTDGLVFAVDAGNTKSFITGSTTVYGLVNYISNNTGLITNTGPNDEFYSSDVYGCWIFDGTDDYIEFGILPEILSGKENITISTWYKTDPSETYIVSLWGDTAGSFQGMAVLLYYQGSNQAFIEVGTDGSNDYAAKNGLSTYMPKGEWYDLTFVFDSSQGTNATKIKMYVNGELQSWTSNPNFAFTGLSTSASNLRLGRDKTAYAGFPFTGNIAKYLIYDRSLTAAEVLHNYNAQKSRFGL